MHPRTPAAVTATLVALLSLPLLTGCVAAAAGAGAGGAIYVTSRGAESLVNAGLSEVDRAVRAVFAEEGIPIQETETDDGGARREIEGPKGDLDVLVTFEREDDDTTRVEVTARKNVAEWDKDYAQRLLEEIVRRT